MRADPAKALALWPIAFELASAYGTVGLTLGYPGSALSLSGLFSTFSKLIVMVVMLAGRHRGLPAAIDPAVHLPSLLNKKPKRSAGGLASLGGSFMDAAQASVRSFIPPTLRFLGMAEHASPHGSVGSSGAGADPEQATVRNLGRGVSFVRVPGQGGQYVIPAAVGGHGGTVSGAHLAAVGLAIARGASFKIGAPYLESVGRNSRMSVGRAAGGTFGRARPPLHHGPSVGASSTGDGTNGRNSAGSTGARAASAARPALTAIFQPRSPAGASRDAPHSAAASSSGAAEPAQVQIELADMHG